MSIPIGNYKAEGPFDNIDALPFRSGVYVILGQPGTSTPWKVVDVGESQNIRERVSNHDRRLCWDRQGYAKLSVAAIYANANDRMRIESELRTQLNPSCGLI